MAALPYMQLYVADYLADTAHLNAAQHGGYLLLLMNYWQRGKPLKNDDARLSSVARMTPEEWAANRAIIAEFFEVTADEWIHARVERDLASVAEKSSKARNAGKTSAERRLNERSTNAQRTLNERSANVQPLRTDTDTEKRNTEQPPVFDADMVAQAVMHEKRLGRIQVRIAIAEVARAELAAGVDGVRLVSDMVEALDAYEKAKPSLEWICGPEKFIGDGLWKNRAGWPWKAGQAPTAKAVNPLDEIRAKRAAAEAALVH